jgi:cytochrome c556
MSEISDNMRVLGLMLKGQVDFDLVGAKAAIQNIEKLAAKTPTLFEIEAVDPHAEAKPEIWSNYEDFVDKALNLKTVAIDAGGSLIDEDGLRDIVMSLGKTCKSCHSMYRN